MKKPIQIKLTDETKDYLRSIDRNVAKKFLEVFDKTKAGYKGDWFRKLNDSEGIFEFRVEVSGNAYRIFAFWDSDHTNSLVVTVNGFQKKTQKTPKRELEKAEALKKNYFKFSLGGPV